MELLREFILQHLGELFGRQLNERSISKIEVQKDDEGFRVINPEDGRELAGDFDVKKMGRDRKRWLKFLKQFDADTVLLRGFGRGGRDIEYPRQLFLDKVVTPPVKQGHVIPIVRGKPE